MVSINIKKLKINLPFIKNFNLVIQAFKAYSKPQFDCLAKSNLDMIGWNIIAKAVCDKNILKIREWLSSKQMQVSSVIYTEGLSNLSKAFETWPEDYNKDIIKYIENVIKHMKLLKKTRSSSSHSKSIDKLGKKIDNYLGKTIELLDERSSNGT